MKSTNHRPTERVLDILELLANLPDGLTLTEISTALSAPKSSIMPLVHTMALRKFIFQDRTSLKYKVGIATYSVGSAYISDKQVMQFLHERMRHIVKESGEICQLGIEDRSMVLYVAKEDSDEPIRLISHVGKHLPLHCSAMGKVLLAYKTRDEIHQLYPDGLEPVTPKTIIDFGTLFQTLDQFRQMGYAVEHEEATAQIHCIAVALCKGGKTIAGLSVSIPSFRMSDDKTTLIIRLLKEAKSEIEAFFNKYDVDILT